MVRKVLVTPLDWGLGHATRCIPVIRELRKQGAEVIIASSGDAYTLLQLEFPESVILELPSYRPVYPAKGSMVFSMVSQIPKFRDTISEENRRVNQYVVEHGIDVVISDNRFGCWSPGARSVFITHQSNPIMPSGFSWMSPLVRNFLGKQINRFEQIWIPDQQESGMTATFNPGGNSKQRFIGWLSRFQPQPPTEWKYEVLALISGPEPQRTIFENLVIEQLLTSGKKALVITGKPGTSSRLKKNNLEIVSHMPSTELQQAIVASEIVLSRSGYSTIMDLIALGKKAIFVPTPQQTEQIFLAAYCQSRQIAFAMDQDKFLLETAWEESKRYRGFSGYAMNNGLLEKAVVNLLQ